LAIQIQRYLVGVVIEYPWSEIPNDAINLSRTLVIVGEERSTNRGHTATLGGADSSPTEFGNGIFDTVPPSWHSALLYFEGYLQGRLLAAINKNA
jgi:hypothetical protein